MTEAFDASALERRYSFLDACPEQFVSSVVTLPIGSLSERVRGLLQWRASLLNGVVPPEGAWPPPDIAAPARQALDAMGLVRFCKGQPELVDALLHDILATFSQRDAALRNDIAARLRDLESLERRRAEEAEQERARKDRRLKIPVTLDEGTLERLRQQAERDARGSPLSPDEGLVRAWGERARAWASISEVFGDLGEIMGRGWDMSLGVLKHVGWQDLLRLQKLIEQLPQLREIVRSLGRLHASDTEETVADTVFVPVRRLEEERREVRTPHIPAETRGIERSGEISRMLPSEAVNLGHPKLRLLWHARRAERALLTYRVEGMEIDRVLVEREATEAQEHRKPRPQRGPIIAVMDTSGSMHGTPELVAKALVLEALRTAHAEKRRCYAYMFGGAGEIVEHELDLSAEGIGRLLVFLGHTFGGGTDVAVLAKVAKLLHENDWKKADVVFVSDGEWGASAHLVRDVTVAREGGTRFHGVQIGNRGKTGLHAVCDPVHIFQDWAAVGGWSK